MFKVLVLALASTFIAFSSRVQAQETKPDASSPNNDIEEIVITTGNTEHSLQNEGLGYRLYEGQELWRFGSRTSGDIAARLAATIGIDTSNPEDQWRLLVLVNKNKIGNGTLADLYTIPKDAIEKIETLEDVDAIKFGGEEGQSVLNVVLKEDYLGITASLDISKPTDSGGANANLFIQYADYSTDYQFSLVAFLGSEEKINADQRDIILEEDTPDCSTALSLTPPFENCEETLFNLASRDEAPFITISPSQNYFSTYAYYYKKISARTNIALSASTYTTINKRDLGLADIWLSEGDDLLQQYSLNALSQKNQTNRIWLQPTLKTKFGKWAFTSKLDISYRNQKSVNEGNLNLDLLQQELVSESQDQLLSIIRAEAGTVPEQWLAVPVISSFESTYLEPSLQLKRNFKVNDLGSVSTSLSGKSTLIFNNIREDTFNHRGTASVSLKTDKLKKFSPIFGKASLGFVFGIYKASNNEPTSTYEQKFSLGLFEDWRVNVSFAQTSKNATSRELFAQEVIRNNVSYFNQPTGSSSFITTISSGNPDLLATKDNQTTLGLSWRPKWFDGFSFSARYSQSKITNSIENLAFSQAYTELLFPERFERNTEGDITLIRIAPINIPLRQLNRLSVNINYEKSFEDKVFLTFTSNVTSTLKNERTFNSESGENITYKFANNGTRFNWKNIATVAFDRKTIKLTHTYNNWRRQTNNSLITEDDDLLRFEGLNIWSLSFSYKNKSVPLRSEFLNSLELSFSVENIFNKKRIITDLEGRTPLAFQQDYQDPKGRVLKIIISSSF